MTGSSTPRPTGMPGTGRFLAVEGIDASGKSTVARHLVDHLSQRGWPVLLFDRHGAVAGSDGYVGDHLRGLRRLIWEYPPAAATSRLGFGHWSHLLAAWFFAVDHTVVRPALSDGRWVVADSWHYKYLARFSVTTGQQRAEPLFDGLSVPSPVVWLDVAPRSCADRRDTLRATEAGEWQGRSTDAEAFVAYQTQVRQVYQRLATANGWLRVGDAGVEATVAVICRRLLDDTSPDAGWSATGREWGS